MVKSNVRTKTLDDLDNNSWVYTNHILQTAAYRKTYLKDYNLRDEIHVFSEDRSNWKKDPWYLNCLIRNMNHSLWMKLQTFLALKKDYLKSQNLCHVNIQAMGSENGFKIYNNNFRV